MLQLRAVVWCSVVLTDTISSISSYCMTKDMQYFCQKTGR